VKYKFFIIIIIITRFLTHVKSFTKWRIASHESAKVSSVVKFSLYQTLESCKTGEIGDYIYRSVERLASTTTIGTIKTIKW